MQVRRAVLEQQVAVFGESGSGKTVLLSAFYGAAQEPAFLQNSLFRVIAEDIGQGSRLHRNYLGMRDSARLPTQTRVAAAANAFSIKLKKHPSGRGARGVPFHALRLVWHDYPGEWFEQDVSGAEEAQRRIDTFRSLLGSDVALLLVDGQRLLDNVGEEERYLRSLFANIRNGLLGLKDDLLVDGKPLLEFPRIWILALSKADVLPDLDVYAFRDLLIDRAADDINELREVIAGCISNSDALSVGEDFILLSSAKFGAGQIEVTQRVGLDLVLPLAATLPFERHLRWVRHHQLPTKVAENLLRGAPALAEALRGKTHLPGPLRRIVDTIGPDVLDHVAEMATDKLRAMHEDAGAKNNQLTEILTGFRLDVAAGETERILLRSQQ